MELKFPNNFEKQSLLFFLFVWEYGVELSYCIKSEIRFDNFFYLAIRKIVILSECFGWVIYCYII